MSTSIAAKRIKKNQYSLIQKVPHLPGKKQKKPSDMSSEDSFTSKHTGHGAMGGLGFQGGSMRSFSVELLNSNCCGISQLPMATRGFNPVWKTLVRNGSPFEPTKNGLHFPKAALMDFVEELRFSSCNSKGGRLQPMGNFGAASGVG